MNSEEYQLLIREKDEAVERYNQSLLLIERLEEELKTLKELSPTSETHFFNMLHKEYVQIIDAMRDKMKAVQEKLHDELENSNKKDREIKILNEKLVEFSRKLNEDEKELRHALKRTEERKLCLESELIASEKKLYYLQNKYQYITDIEEERDKLQHENTTLSKDCNELEFALEVCHQKIECYERELQKMNEDLKLLIEEKVSITRKNSDYEVEVTELKDVILNLNSECSKVNEDTKNLLSDKTETFKVPSQTKMHVDPVSKLNFFDGTCSSVFELCKSVNKLKRITNEYSKRNQQLHAKVNSCQADVKKYRNRILKMNNIISFLKQNLITLQKKLKITTNRWQHETSEIIFKMENRIQDLNEKYEEVKQENAMIKKQWRKEKFQRSTNQD